MKTSKAKKHSVLQGLVKSSLANKRPLPKTKLKGSLKRVGASPLKVGPGSVMPTSPAPKGGDQIMGGAGANLGTNGVF